MTQQFDDPEAIAGAKAIRKGIVRAFNSGTHKADVQIVGSHPTLTKGIPVATDIPAADVIAGRQCTVLFLSPANQDAAVVITIQGALPSVPSGATVAASGTVVAETAFGQASAPGVASPYSRGDHTHGTMTDPITAHVAASDPHTVYGALAQAETWAALQTFNASIAVLGTVTIGDPATTPHVDITVDKLNFHHKPFPPSSEAITHDDIDIVTITATGAGFPVGLTGDLKFTSAGAALQDINANDRMRMSNDGLNTLDFPQVAPLHTGDGKVLWNYGGSTPVNVTAGLGFSLISNTPSPTNTVQGGSMNMGWSGTGTTGKVLGGELLANLSGTGIITELIGGQSRVGSGAAGAITEAISHKIAAPTFGTTKPTLHRGLLVENQGLSGIGTSHGIIVEDQSGSTTNVALSLGTGDVGFYAATPVAQRTGVAVTAAAIHAALVNLGLITA